MNDRRKILKVIPAVALGLGAFALAEETFGVTVAEGLLSPDRRTFDPKKQRRIPDVTGITHTGKQVNFYEDLIKDKVVLIYFMSIAGESVYPVTERMAKVADGLGEKLGKDVFMVSVTRDPFNDSSEKLANFAAQFGAFKGWTFVNLAQKGTVAMNERIYHTRQLPSSPAARKNPSADVAFYGNGVVGLWGTFPVDIQTDDAVRRIGWVMPGKPVGDTPNRAGPRRSTQPGLTSDNRIA
jgi:cytochrome oxidase Cu insertion factor (SCO1/SenC/PrrC family)